MVDAVSPGRIIDLHDDGPTHLQSYHNNDDDNHHLSSVPRSVHEPVAGLVEPMSDDNIDEHVNHDYHEEEEEEEGDHHHHAHEQVHEHEEKKHGNGSALHAAASSLAGTASSAMDSVANHPMTQQAKDTVLKGPVGQAASNEKAKISAEFQDLANARTTPTHPAATGQPLTHYHSMIYRLLSWKNPRATGITFAVIVASIFASRYVHVLRYSLKALYTVLAITASAEVIGKVAFGQGLASQFRPKRYWTVSKASLDRFTGDLEQMTNFVVIEFQRIIFAENIWVTATALVASFTSYWLIKWLPLWGLTLLATCLTFLTPLVYITNRELIDAHLDQAHYIINQQTNQLRDLAAHHTQQATESLKSYAGEYTHKAQEILGQARGKANGSHVKSEDFPVAPSADPVVKKEESPEPSLAL